MIRARFERCGISRLGVCIEGHSGYSADGKDIVCAGVSAIFYALLGYLSNSFGDSLTVKEVSSGRAEIECPEEGEEAVRMACIGILQISENYPFCVSVENRIWNSKFGKKEI